MTVEGKVIAEDIKESLKREAASRARAPRLFIVTVGENDLSERYLRMKKKFGEEVGVTVEKVYFEETIDEESLIREIQKLGDEARNGIIVQLPLPSSLDTQRVLDAIPTLNDPDMLSSESLTAYKEATTKLVPPVVGSIKEILFRHNIFIGNKNVVIMGAGKLVGAPAAIWFGRHDSIVSVVDENTRDAKEIIKTADILVSGVGKPGLITPDMLKDGVAILDAGTSEEGGELKGDVDAACADKALVFTPVPGGIGPVTIAMLFKNLLELTKEVE